MNIFKNIILNVLTTIWIFLMVNAGDLFAQCAMCKASVESNVSEDGIGFASKLNLGILYLFVTPYLLAIVIGYFWVKKSREHRKNLEEAEFRKQKISSL